MQLNKTTIILTTAILILTLLTAGCTDTGGANPETVKYTTPPQEVAVVEETAAVVEDIPEPVETPWYAHMENAEVGTYSTMFGTDYYAVKNSAWGVGNYDLFNPQIEALQILHHSEYTQSNLRLDLELSSDQYRTLIDQYGAMISVTMETIDLDQDGAMDKVAVKYVGSERFGEFETDYDGWDSVGHYISMGIYYDLFK